MTYTVDENEYTIVFSGQIYNTNLLKEDLIKKNYKIETNSDTEILLKLYICYGEESVKKLNGIFSFAIWNKKNLSLFIARDHLGIMPLYYCKIKNTFIFSTDIKAIIQYPSIMNNIKIINLKSNNITDLNFSKTIFENIYELSPASGMLYTNNQIYFCKYWNISKLEVSDKTNLIHSNLENKVKEIIFEQLYSDIPFCLFLINPYTLKSVVNSSLDYCKNKNIAKLNIYILHSKKYPNIEKNLNNLIKNNSDIILNVIYSEEPNIDLLIENVCKNINQEFHICISDINIDSTWNLGLIHKIFKIGRNNRTFYKISISRHKLSSIYR